jgi:hypothetical protein
MLSLFFLRKESFVMPIKSLFSLLILGFFLQGAIAKEPNITFKTNREIYSPGDLIFFNAESSIDGYVYILNLHSDGTLHLIYPNLEDGDNLKKAGKFRLPSQDAKYEFIVEDDIGTETFYLLVSEKKIKSLHKRNYRENESINQKSNWLQRLTAKLKPENWNMTETKIQVLKNMK